jgi:hypothetical protein
LITKKLIWVEATNLRHLSSMRCASRRIIKIKLLGLLLNNQKTKILYLNFWVGVVPQYLRMDKLGLVRHSPLLGASPARHNFRTHWLTCKRIKIEGFCLGSLMLSTRLILQLNSLWANSRSTMKKYLIYTRIKESQLQIDQRLSFKKKMASSLFLILKK